MLSLSRRLAEGAHAGSRRHAIKQEIASLRNVIGIGRANSSPNEKRTYGANEKQMKPNSEAKEPLCDVPCSRSFYYYLVLRDKKGKLIEEIRYLARQDDQDRLDVLERAINMCALGAANHDLSASDINFSASRLPALDGRFSDNTNSNILEDPSTSSDFESTSTDSELRNSMNESTCDSSTQNRSEERLSSAGRNSTDGFISCENVIAQTPRQRLLMKNQLRKKTNGCLTRLVRLIYLL